MERIREARKAAGLTQKQLAEKIGVKHVSVSYYENGTVSPTYDQIQAIADATGVSVAYLMGIGATDEKPAQAQNSAYEAKIYLGVSSGVEKILETLFGKKRNVIVEGTHLNSSIDIYGDGERSTAFASEEDKELIVYAVKSLVESLVNSLRCSPDEAIRHEKELIDSPDFVKQFLAENEKYLK